MKKWQKSTLIVTWIAACIVISVIYCEVKRLDQMRSDTMESDQKIRSNRSTVLTTEKQTSLENPTMQQNTEEDRKAVFEERRKDPLLLLVNKSHPLPETYEVTLATLLDGHQVAKVMYDDLEDMLADAGKAGCSIIVASAYRTKERQEQLLQQEIRKNMRNGMDEKEAEEDALLTVAPYGYSEHETGYTVDLVAAGNQMLDDTQETTKENKWLQKNCAQYGFILRYPKGKEEITGYSYESWHFRYVGKRAAQDITADHLTLEEYLN